MTRTAVAKELAKVLSICRWGRERSLPGSYKLTMSPVSRTRVRRHIIRRCGVELSAVAFKKLATLDELCDVVAPKLTRRRRAFPKEWHLE